MDTYAWIEYFEGTGVGERIRETVEHPKNHAITPAPMVAEIRSKFRRRGMDPEPPTVAVETLSEIAPLDGPLARAAGDEHARLRAKLRDFGMMDAFLLATARARGARIPTGDPHFRGMDDVEFLG